LFKKTKLKVISASTANVTDQDVLYHIAETFEGENFCKFHCFVAICESCFSEIWGCGVLWHGTSEQSV